MLVALLGIIVGLCASLLGIGGNIFIIPLLPLLTGLSLIDAIAIGVASVCFITGVNSYFFYKAKLIDKNLVLLALPFSAITGFVAGHSRGAFDEAYIRIILIGVLGLMLVKLILFRKVLFSLSPLQVKGLIVLLSIVSGLFAGLVGIGNGVLLGPAILSLNLVEHKKISPTINVLMFINSFFASAALMLSRPFIVFSNLNTITIIVIFAIGAAYFGRRFNSLISVKNRKLLVSCVLILTIARLLTS